MPGVSRKRNCAVGGGVDTQKLVAVACGLGLVIAIFCPQPVQQRRLAHVGPAHDGHEPAAVIRRQF